MNQKKHEITCRVAMTIEKKLKAYSDCPEATERHKILWNEWSHNKRCLTRIQQLIFSSFPSYSLHDSSHSEAVLHNIEMILGEETINNLSATDCFLLLHTVFIHDIGMCITDGDRRSIINNPQFIDFIKDKAINGDYDESRFARLLLDIGPNREFVLDFENDNVALKKNLEIYYAITYFLSDYRRKEHGEISKKRLISWLNLSEELNIGFSTLEIPQRLFYLMADCAAVHTKWSFDDVLKLCKEDTGYAHDYVHPRFIAVLLQLGDALDMDNNRFHPLVKEYNGKLPKTSEMHFQKHKAIRRLRITNQKIEIAADCETQDELRIIRSECDWIQKVLEKATYYWAVIKPNDLNISLPTFENISLLLNGEYVPKELVMAKFQISQNKAFNILQGDNIYTNTQFVFLRELIQNASDASKVQYWRECTRKRNFQKKYDPSLKALCEDSLPCDMKEIISPQEFVIVVEMSIVGREKTDRSKMHEVNIDRLSDDIDPYIVNTDKYEYGVLVKVSDFATGITSKEIKEISDVGSSVKTRQNEINDMPGWLKPTSEFGIGLQSVFLVDSRFEATTHARNGEKYSIVFNTRSNNGDGSINVTPLAQNQMDRYGTSFEVFVAYNKKLRHKDSMNSWSGKDPFDNEYDALRPIRHSQELINQMVEYINNMLEDLLFPVHIKILNPYTKHESVINDNIAWFYNVSYDNDTSGVINGKGLYYFDDAKAKLYVWDTQYGACACFGGKRFMTTCEGTERMSQKGIPIYYKGIYAEHMTFEMDIGVLEYMDIKNLLNREQIKLNRNGFTEKGKRLINEKIYPSVLNLAQEALCIVAANSNDTGLLDKIEKKIERIEDEKNNKKALTLKMELHEQIISASVLAYFALLRRLDDFFVTPKASNENIWKLLLDKLSNIIQKYHKNILPDSILYRIPCGRVSTNEDDHIKLQNSAEINSINLAEFFYPENKYAILSIRSYHDGEWMKYLFSIDKNIYDRIKIHICNIDESMEKWNESYSLLEQISTEFLKTDEGDFPELRKFGNLIYGNDVDSTFHWMLENIPTLASFADEKENQRWNLLSSETKDSVYLNKIIKKHIIEKMIRLYFENRIERFSTITWSGYSLLGLKKEKNSIHFVKRGKYSPLGASRTIFPVSAHLFNELKTISENEEFISIKKNIIKYSDNVLKKVENHLSKSGTYLFENYIKMINCFPYRCAENQYIRTDEQVNYEIVELAVKFEGNKDAQPEIETINISMNDMLNAIIIPSIKLAQDNLNKYDSLLKDKIRSVIDKFWYKNGYMKDSLVLYVCKETEKSSFQKEKIEILYNEYIEELISILCEIYSDNEILSAREYLSRVKLLQNEQHNN